MLRRTPFILALAVGACGLVAAQQPAATSTPSPSAPQSQSGQQADKDSNVLILKAPQAPPSVSVAPELRAVELEKREKLTPTTRMQLIRLMTAEFVHTRKYFPLGDKSLTINPQGQVIPGDAVLFQQAQLHGVAAKIGDRIQITAIGIHDKSITLQLNGGAKKKTKWYQHIQVGVGGSGGAYSPTDTVETPTGAEMTLQFNKDVPEMTAEELRKLLSPVLDFSVKSAAQVYAETLPPKIRDAIKNHEVLVGMNREMVIAAKERPPQKDREKDEKGKEYEEWIYGTPPQDVIFVRFYGDEVTQVKTARVGGEVIVKTEKEVDVKDGVATLAVLQASSSPQDVKPPDPNQQQEPVHRPTLRRDGEQPDTEILRAPNGQTTQMPQSHSDEPEWGANGQQQPQGGQQAPAGQQQPPQNPQKPPQ